jgi:hypothetical protein
MPKTKRSNAKNKLGAGKQKVRPVKKSDFSFVDRAKFPPVGSASPLNYLYGGGRSSSSSSGNASSRSSKKKKQIANTKNYNNNKKKIPQAKMPIVDAKSDTAPWFKKNLKKQSKPHQHCQNNANKNGNNIQEKTKLLNALSVTKESLLHLNNELEEFADYVRLSPSELHAREHLIQTIKQSSKKLFGIDESQCQVFGSFASQPVCVFESDVDLAIFGVVPPDDDDDDAYDDDNEDDDDFSFQAKTKVSSVMLEDKSHPNRKKQERVNAWKEIIDLGLQEQEKTAAVKEDEKKEEDTSIEKDDPPLFVLDRMGESDPSELKSVGTEPTGRTLGDGDSVEQQNGDNGDDVDGDSDGDDDSADKLEGLLSRSMKQKANGDDFIDNDDDDSDSVLDKDDDDDYEPGCNDDDSDEDHNNDNMFPSRKRARTRSFVSLSSSTTCSDDGKLDDSGMEVSYMVDRSKKATKKNLGPTGRTRTLVVNALYKLARPLRPFAKNMHVRKKARKLTIGFYVQMCLHKEDL